MSLLTQALTIDGGRTTPKKQLICDLLEKADDYPFAYQLHELHKNEIDDPIDPKRSVRHRPIFRLLHSAEKASN